MGHDTGEINTQVLFVGDRKLSMAPDGKLVVDGSVNILGDLSVGGDFKVDGLLEAKEAKIEKLNVAIPQPDPTTGKSQASIGTATLTAGQTQVVVETTAVTADSKVFVTPITKTDKVLSVTTKVAKTSFTVELTSPATTNIEFNWWVVN